MTLNFASRNFVIVVGMLVGFSTAGWLTSMGPPLCAEESSPASSYQAKNTRDPFIPLVREGRLVNVSAGAGQLMDASSMTLSGILWDPSQTSIALINDAELKVGDTIGGYQVVDIRQDAVVLVRDGKPLTLPLAFEEQGTMQQRSGEGKRHLNRTRR